jgi:hypothetical protein
VTAGPAGSARCAALACDAHGLWAEHARQKIDAKGESRMILLGLILLILGLVLNVGILYTIGVILIIVGAVLWILGAMGRAVGGRRHYW